MRCSARRRPQRQQQEAIEEATQEDFADDGVDPEGMDLPSISDISSTGYLELEQHRELRELVRVAAWDMPLLSERAARFPFEKPNVLHSPFRWRYTSYFGEPHPASKKVVVEFNIGHIQQLNRAQRLKLRKLCGARHNPETDVVRMGCDSFETAAQNKKHLSDTIRQLIAECKDPKADKFEDVPLDTRHHKKKQVHLFPEAWKITPERQAKLEEKRQRLMLEEGQKASEPEQVVSGIASIEAARQISLQEEEQPVMAEARMPLPKGKQGRKQMGQTAGANR